MTLNLKNKTAENLDGFSTNTDKHKIKRSAAIDSFGSESEANIFPYTVRNSVRNNDKIKTKSEMKENHSIHRTKETHGEKSTKCNYESGEQNLFNMNYENIPTDNCDNMDDSDSLHKENYKTNIQNEVRENENAHMKSNLTNKSDELDGFSKTKYKHRVKRSVTLNDIGSDNEADHFPYKRHASIWNSDDTRSEGEMEVNKANHRTKKTHGEKLKKCNNELDEQESFNVNCENIPTDNFDSIDSHDSLYQDNCKTNIQNKAREHKNAHIKSNLKNKRDDLDGLPETKYKHRSKRRVTLDDIGSDTEADSFPHKRQNCIWNSDNTRTNGVQEEIHRKQERKDTFGETSTKFNDQADNNHLLHEESENTESDDSESMDDNGFIFEDPQTSLPETVADDIEGIK